MAGDTYSPVGVDDLRRRPDTVVFDQLELEAAGRLVVADHLDQVGLLLVAKIEAVLEQHAVVRCGGCSRRFGIPSDNSTRGFEELRRCRAPLQRAAQWEKPPRH